MKSVSRSVSFWVARSFLLLLALVFAGCGGGGGEGSAQVPTPIGAPNATPTATGAGLSIYSQRAGGGSRTPWVDDVDIFDTAVFQILTQPANGTASLDGNALRYVPNDPKVSSTDSFTYRATDSGGATVDGVMRVLAFDDASLTRCTRVSTVDGTTGVLISRTRSDPCGFFQQIETRAGSTAGPITINFLRHWPSNTNTPRGIVVLIAGGDLSANINGDNATGVGTSSAGNFLVRTAQLFADAGFIAVTPDRPSDEPAGNVTVDQYRISIKHAVDILGLLKHTNVPPLPVFLVGTSRGAISAFANNVIATGIAISSPVTSNGGNNAFLYVGRPDVPSLIPGSVVRPTHLLWHEGDLCFVTLPAASQTLLTNLTGAGVSALSDTATGGVRVTAPLGAEDPCGALDFHGFLAIEPTAVGLTTAWLNASVDDLGADKLPEAAYVTVSTAAGAAKQIDLATLTRDADGDVRSYALSHTTTVLSGTVALNGAVVTYTPSAGVTNKTDHFVYVVTDGKGGVGAAVISVQIGS